MGKKKIVTLSEYVSKSELLDFALDNDSIDLVDIRNEYEKMKREQILKQHNHNVWQSEDGKWRTYLDDENSPRGYKLKVRTTENAILDAIVQYYVSREKEPFIDKVFNDWIEERRFYGEISNQTYNRYKNDFKRFFPKDCLLMKMKFKDITEADLKTFIKTTIKEKALTEKSYAGLRIILKGIFVHGKDKGLTNISITSFLGDLQLSKRAFAKKAYDKESEVFNESEIGMVKFYLKQRQTIRDLGILLAFETGLRVGELSALKHKDINLEKQFIHVQRTEITYKDPNTSERVCEVQDFPKTEAGDRYLIIPKTAIEVLKQIMELSKGNEYLFSEKGKRIRANAFNRRLTRVCDDLKIKHRSMHKIRKTYGTTLLDADVDKSIVAEQMGHKDITTTMRFYYRSNKSNNTKINQINRALSC